MKGQQTPCRSSSSSSSFSAQLDQLLKNRSTASLDEGNDRSTDKPDPHQTLQHFEADRRDESLVFCVWPAFIWPVLLFLLQVVFQVYLTGGSVPITANLPGSACVLLFSNITTTITSVISLHTKPLHWFDYYRVDLAFLYSLIYKMRPSNSCSWL